MKEDKLIADLRKEIAKAKDEIILTQRQALKAKDDLLEELRQSRATKSPWCSSPVRKLAASTADMWRQCQRAWEDRCSDLDEEPTSRTCRYEPVATESTTVLVTSSMESRAGSIPSTPPA
mmetsp:Transcript_3903/g.8934  ORF Transcript_3903/g.8934 Transcript_3903/m.8934 type:complete len:120 (+) Transcript_3903:1488-1847(+)